MSHSQLSLDNEQMLPFSLLTNRMAHIRQSTVDPAAMDRLANCETAARLAESDWAACYLILPEYAVYYIDLAIRPTVLFSLPILAITIYYVLVDSRIIDLLFLLLTIIA